MRIDRWVLGAAVVVVATGCAAEPDRTPPPPATTATAAVSQFLSAVVDGRSADAATVLGPAAVADRIGAGWLADPPELDDIRLGAERPDRIQTSDEEAAYDEIVFVPVTFHVDDADGLAPDDVSWGYRVGHSAAEGWLILDNGPV